jgi:adenine-specific DNA-methyltransferase
MIKDIMNANDSATPNSQEIAVLKENFPSCFKADGSFDIERFKEFLSDKIAVTGEGYELKFLGKNYARLLASIDTTTVVVPDEEHNLKPENMNSENIYISGDNLDGLKHLLKSYSRKVKLIYIDPPYNTGTDGFVYNDSFNFTIEELSEKLSISEEQAKRILNLTKRGSASHSAWLMFMYSRLLLARDLLSDDGLIFISIDDNENHNLKLLCDDVFGEDNFRNQIAIRRGAKSVQAQFETWDKLGQSVEYLLFYSRNSSYRFPKQMKLLDDMRQGSWNNHWRGTDRPTMRYPLFGITPESGQWRWGKDRSYLAIENYKKMLNDIGVDEKSITQEQIDEWYSNQDDDCDLIPVNLNTIYHRQIQRC